MEILRKTSGNNSFYKTFGSQEEALKIASFLNEQMETTDTKTDNYKFIVKQFTKDELNKISGMNDMLDKDLIGFSEGGSNFYVTGVNTDVGQIKYGKSALDFKSVGVFPNENGELVFTDLTMSRKSSNSAPINKMIKDFGVSESEIINNPLKYMPEQYKLGGLGEARFVLPNPFGDSQIIHTLDGKTKIANQILMRGKDGKQGLYNADYRSVATNLAEYISDSFYNKEFNHIETDHIGFDLAKQYANKHTTGITASSFTNMGEMATIKGVTGQNQGSKKSFTVDKHYLSIEDMRELFQDTGDQRERVNFENETAIKKGATGFKIEFDRNGELKKIVGVGKDGEFELGEKFNVNFNSRSRFQEFVNDKMSQINLHGAPKFSAQESILELNKIIDHSSQNGLTADYTAEWLQRKIKGYYAGIDGADKIDTMLGEGGILSKENLKTFIEGGYKFNAYLDVNRQSKNTEGSVSMMSGAIYDAMGWMNKIGQRASQSDAKMSKAIISVDGEAFDLSKEAKAWSSGIEELQYKKIQFENGHAKKLLDESKRILGQEDIKAAYFSQQNYMLYTNHNAAFQDSNMVAMDLALENISKYDDKNTMLIPFNAMTENVVAGYKNVDYTKLNNENLYVDGTVENKIFRTIIGEDNYSQHIKSKETIVDEYRAIGKRFEGIRNLQDINDRKRYAEAYNSAMGDVNEFIGKHMLESDSRARVKIINDDAVNPGQFKHLTGVNHAYIDGAEFTDKGIRLKTSGIITHGDSVKFMVNEVKSTTNSVMPSVGLVTDSGYIPLSGLNNEKMLSKKRGFVGTLLERSINTLAYNYMIHGNSDDINENFDTWKKAMKENFVVDGIGGKKVNIFDALDIDLSFNDGILTFKNNITDKALAGFDFRSRGLDMSVNQGVHEHIAKKVKENFGFELTDKSGKQFTEKLFTILADAEKGLKETIVGDKNGLNEIQRRNLSSIFVEGGLETINISNGTAKESIIGDVRGLRLINNVHIMKETKSRADQDGLSIGKLSTMVMRDSGMYELADLVEDKIAHDNAGKMEKYIALTGASERYGSPYDVGSEAHKIFSGDVVDLNDKTLRYNAFGLNTTIENYFENSELGKRLQVNYDDRLGKLSDPIHGKLVGFNKNFIEMADKMTNNVNRNKYMQDITYSVVMNDFFMEHNVPGYAFKDETLKKKREAAKVILSKMDKQLRGDFNHMSIVGMDPLGSKTSNGYLRAFEARYKALDILTDGRSAEQANKLIGSKFEELNGITKSQIKEVYDFYSTFSREKNLSSFGSFIKTYGAATYKKEAEKFSFGEDVAERIFLFLNKQGSFLDSVSKGEYAFSKGGKDMDLTNLRDIEKLDGKTDMNAHKMLRFIYDGKIDDAYDSDYNITKMMLDRVHNYTGKKSFNSIELSKIAKSNSFNYIIDDLSTDASGQIISNRSLSELERLIKLNQDLDELDSAIGVERQSDELINAKNSLKNKIKNIKDEALKDPSVNKDAVDGMIKRIDDGLSDINTITKDDLLNISLKNKIEVVGAVNKKDNYRNKAFKLTSEEIDEKYKELEKLRKESMANIKSALGELLDESGPYKYSLIGISDKTDKDKYHAGRMIRSFYENIDPNKSIENLNTRLAEIDELIKATKGSNIYKDDMNAMLKERDVIRGIISNEMDSYINKNINFTNNWKANVDKNIDLINKYASMDLDPKVHLSSIEDEFGFGKAINDITYTMDEIVGSIASKSAMGGKRISKAAQLNADRKRIVSKMVETTQNIYAETSEDFFKKAGALEKMTSTRFKNSVEFSPKEGTVINDYIISEFKDISKNGSISTSDQQEFFKSLRTVYGNEVVDDIYSKFDDHVNIKKNKVDSFKGELSKILDNLSGIVIGDTDSYINAGLDVLTDENNSTRVTYGLLSRNPHQYKGSLRGTRYVTIGDEDKNKSFFSRMFGDRNKMLNTQGNLYLVGKRTAIAAHGDHDGDKFQALIMGKRDFGFLGEDLAKSASFKNRNTFNMYQLMADYQGNLKQSIMDGELSAVEKGIIARAKDAYGMDKNSSNMDVFRKIEHVLYSQMMERKRTEIEVLSENASHAEIAYFHLLSDKSGKKTRDEFSSVLSKMSDEGKLKVFANSISVEDLKDINKYFDEKTLADPAFMEKLNKLKKVEDNFELAKRTLKELGEYFGSSGSIAWNNAALSDSSFAAYSGISRTGTVHYTLTNIRDSAATLMSSDVRATINEFFTDNPNLVDINNLIDGYTSNGKFVLPGSTLDVLIEQLAVSSKLSDGSNPYQRLERFKNLNTMVTEEIFNSFGKEKSAYDFSTYKTISKYLMDNYDENFDIEKFTKETKLNHLLDFAKGSSENGKNRLLNFIGKELKLEDVNDKNFQKKIVEKGLKNEDVLHVLSNVYSTIGSGVMNVTTQMASGKKTDNAYGKLRTKIYKGNQNIFFGINALLESDVVKDGGFNLTTRIFKKFKSILDGNVVDVTTKSPENSGGGNGPTNVPKVDVEDEIIANNAVKTDIEVVNVEELSKTDVEDVFTDTAKTVQAVEDDVVHELIEDPVQKNEIFKRVQKKRGRKPIIGPKDKKRKSKKANDVVTAQMSFEFDEKIEEIESSFDSTAVETETILKNNDELVQSLENRIKELEAESNELKQKASDVSESINSKNQELSELKSVIANTDESIKSKEAQIAAAESKVDELSKTLSEYQNDSERLKNELDDLRNSENRVLTEFDEFKVKTESEIKALNEQKDSLVSEIKEHRKIANEAQKNFDEKQKELMNEHKKVVNNLNSVHEKNKSFKDDEVKKLKDEVASLNAKLKAKTEEAAGLFSENKSLKDGLNKTSSAYAEVKSTANKVEDSYKSIYNKHKKIVIGAGVGVVLGTALSLFQRNRPVVDLDIDEEQYEKSQGSVYRNLGHYTINTNIRSIR